MLATKRVVALIPARAGSKGLPGKNSKLLGGKPLIAWSIDAAKESQFVDRVIVSTESEELAQIARECGADIPFMRPQELATDTATGTDVVLHAIQALREQGDEFDILVLLQPTSPLRQSRDIDQALEKINVGRPKSVVSVTQATHHPFWMNTLPPDQSMANFLPKENKDANRQELPPYFQLNGAVFAAEVAYLENIRSFFGEETVAYVMPDERSVDIDTSIDFKLAELILEI